MDFKDRLAGLREDADMKQYELAEMVHLKGGSISKYEKGQAQPNLDTLIKLAEIFSVSTDYLLGLSSIKNPYAPTQFTPQEAELITKYRRLNKEDQVRIDERINTIIERK